MDWQALAQNFGLPGLLIGVWYLLQSKRDSANEKLENRKLDIEDKKAEAFAVALGAIGAKIDAHTTMDLQSHRELGEGIAEIRGTLEGARWYRDEVTNPGSPPPQAPRRDTPAFGTRAPTRGTHHDKG